VTVKGEEEGGRGSGCNHIYLQVVAALMEDPGGTEQHCGVRVVAAGVHLPGLLALVLPLHFLLIHRNLPRVN
jgi:hypothetical protein